MQATTRSKQFVIDHRIIAVAILIVAFVAVVSGATLLITARSADHPDGAAAVVDAGSAAQQFHRPTDRPASMTGVTPLYTTSDGDLAPAIVTGRSANTAELEANGLPITPALASDDSIWTAFPGHAGFIAPEGDGTATLSRTYYPGHPGFINP